jgi:hypothetical protein
MNTADILRRARYALANSRARYRLGAGGAKPMASLPESAQGLCDCSGFVSWCIGECRKTSDPFYVAFNGGWIETTGVYADATATRGIFTKTENPYPGDIMVWPDRRGEHGHIGIISQVSGNRATKIIHCSKSNDRNTGRAIRETSADRFYTMGAVVVRFDKLRP